MYKFTDIKRILEELIQAEGRILISENHKLINSIWNKQELPQQWKEFFIISVYKMGDIMNYSNLRNFTLFNYIQILSNIFLKVKCIHRQNYLG
jgi:hypothetical protein